MIKLRLLLATASIAMISGCVSSGDGSAMAYLNHPAMDVGRPQTPALAPMLAPIGSDAATANGACLTCAH